MKILFRMKYLNKFKHIFSSLFKCLIRLASLPLLTVDEIYFSPFFFFNFILLFYFIRLSNFLAVGNGTAFNFPRDGELVETIPGRGGGGGERLKFCSFDLRHLPLTRRETDQKWDVVRWMLGRFLHADRLAGCSRLVREKLGSLERSRPSDLARGFLGQVSCIVNIVLLFN